MAPLCGALGDSEFYRVCPFQDLKREVLPQGPFLSALPVCTAGHLLPVVCVSELGLALGTLRPQVELNTGDFSRLAHSCFRMRYFKEKHSCRNRAFTLNHSAKDFFF